MAVGVRDNLWSSESWFYGMRQPDTTRALSNNAYVALGKTIANPLFQLAGAAAAADADKDLADASKTAFRGEGYAYPGTNILSGSFIVSGWVAIIANYKPTEYTAPAVLMQPPWADPPIAMFVLIDS